MKQSLMTRGLLTACILFTSFLCACSSNTASKEDDSNSAVINNLDDKNYVYSAEDLGVSSDDENWIAGTCSVENEIHGLKVDNTEGYKHYSIVPADLDFEINSVPLKSDNGITYECLTCDGEGNYYTVRHTAVLDAPESTKSTNAEIVKVNSSGVELWTTPILAEDSGYDFDAFVFSDKVGIVTATQSGFSVYDSKNGKGTRAFERDHASAFFPAQLYSIRGGRVLLCDTDKNMKYHLYEPDFKKMELGEEISLPSEMTPGQRMCPGRSHDFLTFLNGSIYSFDIGDANVTKKCDFFMSDLLFDYVDKIYEVDDWNFEVFAGITGQKNSLYRLTKVDPSEIRDKQVITLGSEYFDNSIKQAVVAFNQKNEKYKIKITRLDGEYFSSSSDSESQLSLDIKSGDAPDIIIFDSFIYSPDSALFEQGLLQDLTQYVARDPEVSEIPLVDNVFNLGKYNDSLYLITASFDINTALASKDLLDGEQVTLNNYFDICDAHSIKYKDGLGTMTKDNATVFLNSNLLSFVDLRKDTCDFTSEDFRNQLRIINELPRWDSNYKATKYDSYYRYNKSLLLFYQLSSFRQFQTVKDGYFDQDVVFNGIPGRNCAKSYIVPSMMISISSSSLYKDTAWNFIRTLLVDEYQENIDYAFPINKRVLLKKYAESMEEPGVYEEPKDYSYGEVWNVSGKDVTIRPLEKYEADQVLELINSLDSISLNDNPLTHIMSEKLEDYYNGFKDERQTANEIQEAITEFLNPKLFPEGETK